MNACFSVVAFLALVFVSCEEREAHSQVPAEDHSQVPPNDRADQGTKLTDADPALPALMEWQRIFRVKDTQGSVITPTFSSWFALPFDSLKTLFPEYRFFAAEWSITPAPGIEEELTGFAGPRGVTVVFDDGGKVMMSFDHWGGDRRGYKDGHGEHGYQAFGDLLQAAKITIGNRNDARIVWNAFCHVHRWSSWKKSLPATKTSDHTWHLGTAAQAERYFYYEVRLNSASEVIGASLQSDELQKPGEQDGADQPATAPEPESQGDDQPNPESESRPQ